MSLTRSAALGAIGVLAITGCSSASSDSGPTGDIIVTVTASGDACNVDMAKIPVGQVTVEGKNTASGEGEVYLYSEQNGEFNTIVGEVEGLTPGIAKTFTVDLQPGKYEFACKVNDKDLRVPVTVS